MRTTIAALLILSIASLIEARTWRVNPAGTGDAPTLHAAMDSAVAGDIVLAEAGHYVLPARLRVPQNVQLIGEFGPAQTVVSRDAPIELGTVELLSGARMSGVHIRGNTLPVLWVTNNLVEHCIVEAVVPVRLVDGVVAEFRSCLLISEGQIAVPANFLACIIMADLGSGAVGSTLFACDVLGDVHPDIDASSANLNFSLDPQFCGIPGSGDYLLQSTSPCLPENNPYDVPVLVGPLLQGCGTVGTEERTWGGVKALYRSP